MLGFSFGEILLLAVVAVVFIGPKDMPVVMRAVAKGLRQLKALSHELKSAFDDLAQESGLHEAHSEINREMRRVTHITGDDGDVHEAYDISDLLPPPKPANPPAAEEP